MTRISRIVFCVFTLFCTGGMIVAWSDAQVTDFQVKLYFLATASACWGVLGSWEWIFRKPNK